MLKWFKRFKRSEKGQGMVEYGLILALVSIVALGALGGIGGKVSDTFDKVVGIVSGAETVPDVSEESIYTDEEVQDLVDNQGYIKVATADDLNNVRNNLSGKYIQVKDIDLSLSGIDNFEPIGTTDNRFKGTFDGGGYTISNLTINTGDYNGTGLFGYAEGASFKNVGLEDVNVKGRNNVGGLVGYQSSSSTTNSYATGTVTGDSYVGGLVGRQQYSSEVTSSYTTGNVTGTGSNVGVLVGGQSSSSITSSYATGNVIGNVTGNGHSVGGLVGYNGGLSTVTNSYATGNVTGNDRVGGLVGTQSGSSTTNSYATGTVNGNDRVGGLVGHQDNSSTTSSYYDTETTGQTNSDGGEGKTTAEIKNKDTYVDWDFDTIWEIESNQYPTHR